LLIVGLTAGPVDEGEAEVEVLEDDAALETLAEAEVAEEEGALETVAELLLEVPVNS
jgi:hypothetical protein